MSTPTATDSTWAFDAIGTSWAIDAAAPVSPIARDAVSAVIERFDRDWSRFRDDSLVSALADGRTASVALPEDADAMLSLYDELDRATAGAVNPLVGDALARLGYDARLTLAPQGGPVAAPDWRRDLSWSDGMLRLARPATIDVGALGKGRLVDLVIDALASHVGGDLIVDASGDLAARGAPVQVGLEHPYDASRVIGVVTVQDEALCASAINRRAWGDGLHHVLDARTGVPVRAYAATWALADTAMRADALATALFFDGGPELAASWDAQWVRMRTDGRVEWSPGFSGEIFA
ncbi:thiamine biosynthesis lipoprotein [Microbacterium sp. ru370.1]|uniref:FAD:protein FMN transferase n=1 Tax=unclassified Microbacterium TaxID=2609290 RepID=UPI00088898CE|nr:MULTISPECIES: FAD:protein FMN transferase [unclassified Microbacterium]SDP03362.1 thiamine biosynthesis lipoprotein [Microbacterium sp. ru370.1]SIT91670.1 thiamine biosynthesis lipoprotein [Microbacterium sp. RU1D]